MASTVNQRLDPQAVGARIKALREKRGLSQRQIAGDGCNSAYVSVLEKGNRSPSLDTLTYLADRLGTSARFLETGDLEPWQQGLDDVGLELGDLEANEIAVLQQNVADAERHAARILAETVLMIRRDNGRDLYRAGLTLDEAAHYTRCPVQLLHDAITETDTQEHEAHQEQSTLAVLATGHRDATPAEIAEERDGALESMASGELHVTETTRKLAQAELLDRKRRAER